MKPGEKGYALIELLIAITIMAVASGAAGVAIFQILRNIEHNNDHLTVVRQVENAGYWISRDGQMAVSANVTATLTGSDFLLLSWSTLDSNNNPVLHSARYSLEDLTGGTYTLKRNYQSGTTNQTTLIAQHIYYDLDDVASTSNTSYEDGVLTVKLTAVSEQIAESREYQIEHRPNF